MRILPALLISSLLGIACRADVVVVATSKGETARRTGEILEFTGFELKLRNSGRETSIPAELVIDIETAWNEQHRAGDRSLSAGKFAVALTEYVAALNSEKRGWVRRRIAAQMVRCYRHEQQIEQAGQLFLNIVRNDPTTQYFDAIPLAWTPQTPTGPLERQALQWLENRKDHVARLIGASWLLSTDRRGAATAALRDLTTQAESRVALLAQAQLWQTEIVTAKAADVGGWREKIGRLPPSLRAGPFYVLGRAQAYLKQHEQAALAMMRVPILYPAERELSAAALLGAAIELQKAGQFPQATNLYRELIADYSAYPQATEAQARLNALRDE